MDGHYRNPATTADAFRNGWLHTGDVVRCDARGRFHYLSRTKDMIRRSGENIAAAEVQEVLMRHPGVRLAAVPAVEDDLRGEEVMAYVVPGDGVSRKVVSPAALSAFCVERLARFKVPRYWKYRDDLSRTPSERIRKEALREEHDDPTAGPGVEWKSDGADGVQAIINADRPVILPILRHPRFRSGHGSSGRTSPRPSARVRPARSADRRANTSSC